MSSAGTAGKRQRRESNQVSDSSGPQSFSGRSLRSALKEGTPGAGLRPPRGNPTSLACPSVANPSRPSDSSGYGALWWPACKDEDRPAPGSRT